MNIRPLHWIALASLTASLSVFIWQVFHPQPFSSTLENFRDFYGYYLIQLSFLHQGYLPYRDFASSYPPLFLYSMYPFYLISSNLAAIPIVLANGFSALIVYLVVRSRAAERVSVLCALLYAVSPFFLLYEGTAWLSEQPMVLFLLLSIYLMQERKFIPSSLAFGIAVLMKQDALFVAPVFLFWLFKLSGLRVGIQALVYGLLFALLISAPFLIVNPVAYVYALSLGRIFSYTPRFLIDQIGSGMTVGTLVSGINNPSYTCLNPVGNIFGVSQICTALGANGNILTDVISGSTPLQTRDVLTFFAVVLLAPVIFEVTVVPMKSRFLFSFAATSTLVVLLLVLFGQLSAYKYYLVPVYSLLIVSSDDFTTLVITAVIPIVTVLVPYSYLTILLPIMEIHLVALHWSLSKRSDSILIADAVERHQQS